MTAPSSSGANANNAPHVVEPQATESGPFHRDFRFWFVMTALCTMYTLCSLENTVVVTSLPTIVDQLHLGSSYVWVTNVFFLAATVVQPLTGQLASLFGRRHVALAVVTLYILGSGLAGGANGPVMLIAGRAVQGAGSGGMMTISSIVISDLVPLRLRSSYQAVLALTFAVGMAVGPVVGGAIVQNTTWRWVFYINLPIGGVSLVLLWLFLRVKWDRDTDTWDKLKRVDVAGNGVLVASTTSVLLALTWAGSEYPWSTYRIIVPLTLGILGLVAAFSFEGTKWVREPVIPLRLFANRTSVILYVNTFTMSMLNYWIFFFLPLYFQSVQLSPPTRSGIQILPITLIAVPGAAIGGIALAKWGRYKLLHIIGFSLLTADFGSLSTLTRDSSAAQWICLQIAPSLGAGMVLDTLLPPFQGGVEEVDSAAAAAAWGFIRGFGNIWGVAVPAAIFNFYSSRFAGDVVSDPAARWPLQNGGAYSKATADFVNSFPEPTRSQIIHVFTQSLRRVFIISMAFPALSLLLSFVEREVKLRTKLETEFGLEEREKLGSRPNPQGLAA